MRAWLVLSFGILCGLGLASTSEAQASASAPDPLVVAASSLARSTKRQAERDPLARSALTLPEPQLTFETARGKGRATGTIGFVADTAGGETTLGFAVSTPIGDSADSEATAIDLRGFGNGSAITVSVGGSSLFKSFKNTDVIGACTKRHLEAVDCTAGKLEDADAALSDALLAIVFKKVPLLYGGSVTFGRNQFSFANGTGTRQEPAWHSDFQGEGSLGLLVNGRKDLLAFHLTYSDMFKASRDKTQLCKVLSGSVSRCDPVIVGEPTEERSSIATIEYRWQIRGNPKVPIAVAPKLQYGFGLDSTADSKSFEVPVYFFQEKPGQASGPPKLNGGFSAGWRSEVGFQAAVFFGATFHLFQL